MTQLDAALALERPCRPCQDDDHQGCMHPMLSEVGWGCCCDGLDRDPDPPRWRP